MTSPPTVLTGTENSPITKHHIVCLEEVHCPIPAFSFSFPHTYTGYASTPTSATEIASRLEDATIAITTIVPITADVLRSCPHLQCVVIMATGVEWVDTDAFREKGVRVVNCPGANVGSVAEHAIALYFASRRKVVELHNAVKGSEEWREHRTLVHRFADAPHTTRQEVVAIIGYGAVGKRIEVVSRALGMQVLVAERKGVMGSEVREGRVAFETAVQRATVVMVAVAKSVETVGLIGEVELKAMRGDAVVVNVARGGIVDEKALVRALKGEWISGAATDVFEGEPPVHGESVLLDDVPNLTVSPHIAWFSESTIRNLQDMLVEGVEGYVEGNLVNVVC
ncbi:hypothetical protein BDW62DRAFT_220119 [Aspergillus aurantiobrunneus]